jgi:hypothetical protein
VDAGADVIMGGGPHSLRGIEIYKGRPVFYGLGVFFINGDIEMTQESAQNVFPDASGHAPPPPPQRSARAGGNPASWYDGIVAVTEFETGGAKRILLYPLDLGNTYDRTRRVSRIWPRPQTRSEYCKICKGTPRNSGPGLQPRIPSASSRSDRIRRTRQAPRDDPLGKSAQDVGGAGFSRAAPGASDKVPGCGGEQPRCLIVW